MQVDSQVEADGCLGRDGGAYFGKRYSSGYEFGRGGYELRT
jgi:hypothetical protein